MLRLIVDCIDEYYQQKIVKIIFKTFSDLMEEGGINNMDPDSLSNLTLTESELLNLQQAGVLVANSNSHFSQNDLDTLASIQVVLIQN